MSLTELPIELFHDIISILDLRSISRLSQTNHDLHIKVEEHTIYRSLTTNPTSLKTIRILSQTTILPLHTLLTLTAALNTDLCACCHIHRTSYISLPSFTRACFTCLHQCQQHQLIPIALATWTFNLVPSDLEHITLYTIPGTYDGINVRFSRPQSTPLVNAIQARDIAISIHGASALDMYMAQRNVDVAPYNWPEFDRYYFVTPYSRMKVSDCEVRLRGKTVVLGNGTYEAGGNAWSWRGLVGMGAAPWPIWVGEVGELVLGGGDLVDFSVED